MKGIWVTWEFQRRNRGISLALGWPLYEIVIEKHRILRYFCSAMETIKVMNKERPDFVAAQNPSIVLALLTILLKPFFRYKTLIDAHNSGICPEEGKSLALTLVSKWLQRNADLTIVTNEDLKFVVESNGGVAFVLPDRLPQVPDETSHPLDGRFNIVYICTYNVDEPYKEVLDAARMIPGDVMIYITGKCQGKVDPHCVPGNVKLVGFLPDDEFWALLFSSDFIMDLTLREGCLLCGAYEGVSILKPLILSDTKALRSYFSEGSVYVAPNPESIAKGVLDAIRDVEELRFGIGRLRERLKDAWSGALKDLVRTIESIG